MTNQSMIPLFRYAHVTDPHFSPLNKIPSSRTATYFEDVNFEWNSFCNHLKNPQKDPSFKYDASFISGDLFHLKKQEYYTPEHTLFYRALFQETLVPTYTIPGNHDLPNSSISNYHKTIYSAVHTDHSLLRPLYSKNKPYAFEYIVKQVQDLYLVSAIWGVPYLPLSDLKEALPLLNIEIESFQQEYLSVFPNSIFIHTVLLHPDALPNEDTSLPFEIISWNTLLQQLPNANILCLGHIHQSYPIFYQPSPVTGLPQFISKPFSFGRVVKDYFSNSDILEHHRPMFTDIQIYLDPADTSLQFKLSYETLEYRTFKDIFVPDALSQELAKSKKISTFLKNVRSNFGSIESAFTVPNPTNLLNNPKIPERIRELILSYLEKRV